MGERPNKYCWNWLGPTGSATSGFSGYIQLAYCSSAKGLPVARGGGGG